MTYQETFASHPSDSADEAEHVVRQYDTLIAECDTTIDQLSTALREVNEKRDAMVALREEARSLQGVGPRLRAMRAHAQKHGIVPGQPGPQVTLRVVPSPPAPDQEPQTAAEDSMRVTAEPESPRPAEVIIRSKKQQEVLTVIASRPDLPWGSGDLAQVLGIPADPRERKSLRNCLRALVVCGALERISREDDRHVYYRPRMNWRFA
ncbi:hypothetical protein [Streptomyces cahuitamycinicus]|uniref:hypothetical protein n=1 Tax=Streptomyces cahuitamycinicus TaxID=2070367 RepID=UPI0011AEE4B0|nr:hypothetical protein [Streptomyces cahuitamycinicus]